MGQRYCHALLALLAIVVLATAAEDTGWWRVPAAGPVCVWGCVPLLLLLLLC